RLAKACGNRIRARIVWEYSNSNVFVTKPGAFTDLAVSAIEEATGRKPELSTSGGTSDGRFLAAVSREVVEFGPVSASIHAIDEHVKLADVGPLSQVFEHALAALLGRA
ncbi:MAG TPA: M20/M25/M40 family metallo-hydrolase, partial [Vicinamibacterales bacterium]